MLLYKIVKPSVEIMGDRSAGWIDVAAKVLAGLGTGRIHRCAVCNRGSSNAITCWIPDHRRISSPFNTQRVQISRLLPLLLGFREASVDLMLLQIPDIYWKSTTKDVIWFSSGSHDSRPGNIMEIAVTARGIAFSSISWVKSFLKIGASVRAR